MRDCNVCVVDDSADEAQILCDGLKLHDYGAVAARSGEAALKICHEQPIDMVLLDVCMPGMDGFEVCRRLKESPQTRDIGVIFVTVKGDPEDVSHGFDLGALDYITKPYNLPMVMVRIEAALRMKEMGNKLRLRQEAVSDNTYTDQLTGLRNRRYLMERLQEEVEKAHRYNYPVSCVVLDVDEVQALDEDLGPASIDDLLIEIGMSLRNHSRIYDILARYDGTLLAAVLPHAPADNAVGYANKILEEVDATTFSDPSFPTKAQLRAGIASCQNGAARGADLVFGEAMRCLLQARSHPAKRLVMRNLPE